MKRNKLATLTATIVALYVCGDVGIALAQNAQPTPPPNGAAPMVKPPEAASGAHGSSDPDNMPVKRPPNPTNDRMSHPPPASGANAK